MRDRRLRLSIMVGVVAAALLMSGLGVNAQTPAVRVGGISYLTGRFASFGQDMKKGIELAVSKINSEGGVLGGAKFEFDLQDSATEPTQAIALARRFAGQKDVLGIVGPGGSPEFFAVNEICPALNIPMVSVGSQAPIEKDKTCKWFVRVNLASNPPLLGAVLQYLKDQLGVKTFAILYDRANNSTAADRQVLREAVTLVGGLELVREEAYAAGDKEFGSQLDAILRTKPDAIWLASAMPEWPIIMQQARARGFQGQFVGGSGLNDVSGAKIAGAAANGYVTFIPLDINSARAPVRDFVRRYRAAYGAGPIATYTAYGYDSVLIFADAVRRAGSRDRSAIMKALGATRNFEAVTGTYTFDGWGDNIAPQPYIAQLTSRGELQVIAIATLKK